MPKHYLSAVTIVKDEHPYIREWLHFHRLVGFERFYIFENGTDLATTKEIQRDPELAPLCEIIHWPGKFAQLQCYEHYLAHLADQTQWAGFFDCDEFMFRTDHGDMRDALREIEHAPALGINWLMFGSNGHIKQPDGLVTKNYTRRAHHDRPLFLPQRAMRPNPKSPSDYWPFFSEIKSIVQPSRVAGVLSPHSFKYKNGDSAIDENFEPLPTSHMMARTERVRVDKFRVHHYWTRSIEEFTAKVARGRSDTTSTYDMKEALLREYTMNEVVDETALPIAARIPPIDSPKHVVPRASFPMPQGTVTAVHKRGQFYNFLWQNPKDTVQGVHKVGQFYESEELELIERNLKRRDITLFDVGSNVGNHAIYFAKVMNVKKVVVFEPYPPAIALLRANLALNACDNVETGYLGFGLGETAATMGAYEPWENNMSAARLKRETPGEEGHKIPVLPGDRFAMGYLDLGFLKIDVEGMELQVLRGFSWAIRRYKPDMFVEVMDASGPNFLQWCEQNNYRVVETYRRYEHLQNYYVRAK